MNKVILLSAQTAKLQIGNQLTATIDTMSSQGKKHFKINIITDDDTISKVIDDVADEIETEISNQVDHIADNVDTKADYMESQVELERVKNEKYENALGLSIPILSILAVFGYLAFRSYQTRKWKESLLNKGISIDEINKQDLDKGIKFDINDNDLDTYEKRKNMKYAIVFGSFGLAILIGTIMSEAGYFFGFLFLFLGSGFWYFNNRINQKL